MEVREILGKQLTELRGKKGISRQSAADFLSISRASLEYYEKGKRLPDAETLAKLADYYDVSTDYLLGRTENSIGENNLLKRIVKDMGMSVEDVEWALDGIDEMIYSQSDEFARVVIDMLTHGSDAYIRFFNMIGAFEELQKKTSLYANSKIFCPNIQHELSILFTKAELSEYKEKIDIIISKNIICEHNYKRLLYQINSSMESLIDIYSNLSEFNGYRYNTRDDWLKIFNLSLEEIKAILQDEEINMYPF